MAKSFPYLHFNGACREAFTFYTGVFGGELEMDIVGDTPMKDHMPPELHDRVLHCVLTSGDFALMGSDMSGSIDDPVVPGNLHSVVVTTETVAELRDLYEKLRDGATTHHEIVEEFFGTYGDLTDKFGVSWMFQCDAKPQT